jgi:uncharacterized protein (DUF1330 family)
MPAYLVIDLDVHDPERYAAYIREVPRFIKKYGGEYIVRGGEHEVIEGTWKPKRLVVIRFPNRQAIRDCFADPEYQPLSALRREVASTNSVAVDGL